MADATVGYDTHGTDRLHTPMQRIADYLPAAVGIRGAADVVTLVQARLAGESN
jgi:hypothetical protein